MSVKKRIYADIDRAADDEPSISELEHRIAVTRSDLDRNLSAIEQQLSLDALLSQAVTYLRSTPGEFIANLGHSAKVNPVPTTLLGVSLGWLMLSSQRRTDNANLKNEGGHGAGADAKGDTSLSEEIGSQLTEGVTEIKRKFSSKLEQMGDKLSDADKHAEEVFQRAHRIIAQKQKRVEAGAHELVENHPFVLGAIAFVAGAAIAASLKPTRLENEMLGEFRDRASSEAENRVQEQMERGVTTAGNTLENPSYSSENEALSKGFAYPYDIEQQNVLPRQKSGSIAFPHTPDK